MKPEAIKDFYMINGEMRSTTDVEIFEKIEKPPIYEVIRVIGGVPLFLEDHLSRMAESAHIVNYEIERKPEDIEADMKSLIIKNRIHNLNIKLLCTDVEGMGQVFLVYFIDSFYPPEKYYKSGIHTILLHYERKNPNAKVLINSFKEEVARTLEEKEAFEALLVNREGYIPEGSRSNIFFVKGEKVYTAPKGDVLLGITRKHIVDICEKLGIKVIEENIHVDDLEKLDGAFMSGTSVNVLPITSVDHIELGSVNNKIIKKINNTYVDRMRNYINAKNLEWKEK